MTKITFIIPCFNEVAHTEKCISSIIANSPVGRFNFVFIDNGSTDKTPRILSKVPNSAVITNEKNIYVNPAWNQGFKHVLEHEDCDYVCLCNNDIEVAPHWLDKIFELFDAGRNEWFLPVSNSQDNPPFGNNHDEFRRYYKSLDNLKLWPITSNFVGFCMFFRKEHIKLFYPIPPQLRVIRGDDWITDCIAHSNACCFRVSHCPVLHFGSATQQIIPRLGEIRDVDVNEFSKICNTTYKERGIRRIFDHRFQVGLL